MAMFQSYEKDRISFEADVAFVKKQMKTPIIENVLQKDDEIVIRYLWKTESYSVTEWYHNAMRGRTYARFMAVAHDGSHTVTWYEDPWSDKVHLW